MVAISFIQLDLADASARTALHVASQDGQVDALKEILGRSVDVNATDAAGDSALHSAALAGKVCTGGDAAAQGVEEVES